MSAYFHSYLCGRKAAEWLIDMKKFRTSISVTIMIFAAIGGYLTGSTANEPMGGAILFAMIAGLACIVYAIDNQGK